MTSRNFLLLAALAAAPLCAQDSHRFEVFGGFAQERPDETLTDQRNGWIASHTAYIKPWVGIEVEISGLYGEYDYPAINGRPAEGDLSDNLQTYFAGPRFRLFQNQRFTFSAHTLFGVAQQRFEGPLFFEQLQVPVRTESSVNGFGGAVGAALDVRLNDRFSWRIQPDYVFRDRNGMQSSLRISTGVVIGFGGK